MYTGRIRLEELTRNGEKNMTQPPARYDDTVRFTALGLSGFLWLAAGSPAPGQTLPLSASEPVAPGVTFYRFDARAFSGPEAPTCARLLLIAAKSARLDLELGKDGTQGRDTVPAMAARRGALAAVNAGFFATDGDPAGIFKINGLLVSDTTRPRGAVGFTRPEGPPLIFDRVTARARLRIGRAVVPATGVDTSRGARAVIVYTPRYGATTRTTGDGTEWIVAGRPMRVTSISTQSAALSTPSSIPASGFVISASGVIPPALARLKTGDRIDITFQYATALGTAPTAW